MYLNSTAQRALLLGGVALIATVGLIAWTHRSAAPAPAYYPNAAQDYTQPVSAPGAAPVVYSASPFGSSLEPPVPQPAFTEPENTDRGVAGGSRYESSADREYVNHRRRVIVKKRPLKHSLEIIGGSAAGGALIGGLAGGGKGAGIGALVGGGGGFLYDRLTRKKKVVVTQ
jgi:hypothetical protein